MSYHSKDLGTGKFFCLPYILDIDFSLYKQGQTAIGAEYLTYKEREKYTSEKQRSRKQTCKQKDGQTREKMSIMS